jgi:hypothetical protein
MIKMTQLLTESESGLVNHAIRELELIGYKIDEDITEINSDDDYDTMVAKCIVDLIKMFASQGHSGFTAPYTIDAFTKLAKHQNLTPINMTPDEWMDVSGYGDGTPLWQNKRNVALFSKDGGKTWYDVSENPKNHANECTSFINKEYKRLVEIKK